MTTPVQPAAATAAHLDVNRRHDFELLFDVADGNPNGDPDAGNLPRVDPETMQGLVTDVAIKRKVRNFVAAVQGDGGATESSRFKIYVESDGRALNAQHRRAYEALDMKSTGTKQRREDIDRARDWMCANFFDVRVFGAVMTTGVNCGQVRGPIQLTFARSIDPIVPLDLSITRVAVTREEEADVSVGEEGETSGKRTEMGRKPIVPYGLYRAHGFYNPHFAAQTGLTTEDLALFWRALAQMWDLDRSSARGMMACRGLIVFSHDSSLGNAPAHQLLERVAIERRAGVIAPRSFRNYEVTVDEANLPDGVTVARLC